MKIASLGFCDHNIRDVSMDEKSITKAAQSLEAHLKSLKQRHENELKAMRSRHRAEVASLEMRLESMRGSTRKRTDRSKLN